LHFWGLRELKKLHAIVMFRGRRVGPNSIFGKGQKKDWFYPVIDVVIP
jgi:hypothetical protein